MAQRSSAARNLNPHGPLGTACAVDVAPAGRSVRRTLIKENQLSAHDSMAAFTSTATEARKPLTEKTLPAILIIGLSCNG